MTSDPVYLWNQQAAVEHALSEHLTCRTCGERLPYYPLEGLFQHELIHAQGEERQEIQAMIADLSNPKGLAAQLGRQNFADPKFIDYAEKNGLLTRVRGKG